MLSWILALNTMFHLKKKQHAGSFREAKLKDEIFHGLLYL